jgi:hypothetical protein
MFSAYSEEEEKSWLQKIIFKEIMAENEIW